MTKIIHVINDLKFLKSPIEQFSIEGVQNLYILYKFNKKKQREYSKRLNVIVVNNWLSLLSIVNKHKAILVFHSFYINPFLYPFLRKKKVLWISWGYDIYEDISYQLLAPCPILINLYKENTRKIYINKCKNRWMEITKKCIKFPSRLFFKYVIFKRIDYITTMLEDEYNLIFKNFKQRPKRFHFRYINNKKTINKVPDLGFNILLGNSASPENNHLDIFLHLEKTLRPKELESNRLIIVPLSYGNNEYANIISSYGFKLFNDNFAPLLSFMAMEKYRKVLKTCSFAIMGHMRQQALGNVFMCLQLGVKVFLYKDSILFNSLIKMGFLIFSIEDITFESLQNPLTIFEKKHNLKTYNKVFSPDHYYSLFESSFKDLIS